MWAAKSERATRLGGVLKSSRRGKGGGGGGRGSIPNNFILSSTSRPPSVRPSGARRARGHLHLALARAVLCDDGDDDVIISEDTRARARPPHEVTFPQISPPADTVPFLSSLRRHSKLHSKEGVTNFALALSICIRRER